MVRASGHFCYSLFGRVFCHLQALCAGYSVKGITSMRKTSIRFPSQRGIFLAQHAEDTGGRQIVLHGDAAGLRSFGELLIALAELDQTKCPPNDPNWWDVGMSVHLRPGLHIHPQSLKLVAMRLDGRKTGHLPDWFKVARLKPSRAVVETWVENAEPVVAPNRRPSRRSAQVRRTRGGR